MLCTQKDCTEHVEIFGIGGFYHGPREEGHHYKFVRAKCPKHGEIPIWPWHWHKVMPSYQKKVQAKQQ